MSLAEHLSSEHHKNEYIMECTDNCFDSEQTYCSQHLQERCVSCGNIWDGQSQCTCWTSVAIKGLRLRLRRRRRLSSSSCEEVSSTSDITPVKRRCTPPVISLLTEDEADDEGEDDSLPTLSDWSGETIVNLITSDEEEGSEEETVDLVTSDEEEEEEETDPRFLNQYILWEAKEVAVSIVDCLFPRFISLRFFFGGKLIASCFIIVGG